MIALPPENERGRLPAADRSRFDSHPDHTPREDDWLRAVDRFHRASRLHLREREVCALERIARALEGGAR